MINLIESSSFSFPKNENKTNQDSFLSPKKIGDGYLFAVADGVGSYQGADLASNTATSRLNKTTEINNLNDINLIFDDILRNIIHISKDNSNLSNAATTLTFCYLNDQGLNIGHVGDCRIYLKDEKNKLHQVTKDHTLHQKLIDDGIFTRQQLKNRSGKNKLTTAISRSVDLKFDIFTINKNELPIIDGYLYIYLMSDGTHSFWEKRPKFSINTMSNIIQYSSSLLNRIRRSTPTDDFTLVAMKFKIT